MNDADSIALLEGSLNQAAEIIAAVGPGQWSLPTPCVGWDVRALVRHLVGQDLRNFTIAARGESPNWQAPAEDPGGDWADAFSQGAKQLLATWRAADLEQRVSVPGGGQAPLSSRADQQIAELVVHGWDMARATGQMRELDPQLAAHALAWSQQMLRPEFRGPGKAFDVEVPVAEGAPSYDRLAGWFGRDPAWRPGGA